MSSPSCLPSLAAADRRRYARQLIVPGFGDAGQQALEGACVRVFGATMEAEVCALYLVGAGVGRVVVHPTLVDRCRALNSRVTVTTPAMPAGPAAQTTATTQAMGLVPATGTARDAFAGAPEGDEASSSVALWTGRADPESDASGESWMLGPESPESDGASSNTALSGASLARWAIVTILQRARAPQSPAVVVGDVLEASGDPRERGMARLTDGNSDAPPALCTSDRGIGGAR
ncbi:MAG: hypothetical protein H6729_03460 [Deltaproteobacteria bacterium]|nr:hypothetical protein [Deltaproteobacteria bacterium]